MKIYAKVGESFQQIGGQCPLGFIEMKEPRPEEGHWVAREGGEWGRDHTVNIRLRQDAYRTESDPLGFEYLFDMSPESEKAWRDKVLEIKSRYPLQQTRPAIKE